MCLMVRLGPEQLHSGYGDGKWATADQAGGGGVVLDGTRSGLLLPVERTACGPNELSGATTRRGFIDAGGRPVASAGVDHL